MNGDQWQRAKKLTANDEVAEAFGYAVAIDGGMITVGAYESDDQERGANSGAAYVYVLGNGDWRLSNTLMADDGAANDNFGYSVAVSGSTALIGAHFDDVLPDNGGIYSDAGSAYFATMAVTCTRDSCSCVYGAAGPECRQRPLCGDGVRQAVEGCDDGNTMDGDGCSSQCALDPVGSALMSPTSLRRNLRRRYRSGD